MTDRLAPPDYRILAPRAVLTGGADALNNINTTPLPDGAQCYVTGVRANYRLNKSSLAGILPSSGPGSWLPDSGGSEIALAIITPQMFGAVADGTTDDTAAIQAAIDSLPTNIEGNQTQFMVFFPPGVYIVTDMILIEHLAGAIFYGAGMHESIIKYDGVAGKRAIVQVYNSRDLQFRDLQITPNLSVPANAPDMSLEIQGDTTDPDIGPLSTSTRFMAYRLWCYGGQRAAVAHTYKVGSLLNVNDQCYFENCILNALGVTGAAAYSLGNPWEWAPGTQFSNMKRMTFVHSVFNAQPNTTDTYGFKASGGSWTLRDCVINYGIGIYQNVQGEQIQLDNVYSEACDQFLLFDGLSVTPIKITGLQVDPTEASAAGTINGVDVTYPLIFRNTVGPIEIDSCQIGTVYTQLAQVRIETTGANIGLVYQVSIKNCTFTGTAGNGTGSYYVGGVSLDALLTGTITLENNIYLAEAAAQALNYFIEHAFDPSQITNLEAWWDARFASDFTFSAGSSISTWANHAGTAGVSLDVTDGGSAVQDPVLVSSDEPYVDFQGSQELESGAYALSQPTTFRMAGFFDPTCPINGSFTDGRVINTREFGISSVVNRNLRVYAGNVGLSGANGIAAVSETDPQRMMGGTFNGASSQLDENGYPTTTGDAGASAASGIILGGRTGVANTVIGRMYWAAIWSRVLTPAEDGCLAANMPGIRVA